MGEAGAERRQTGQEWGRFSTSSASFTPMMKSTCVEGHFGGRWVYLGSGHCRLGAMGSVEADL